MSHETKDGARESSDVQREVRPASLTRWFHFPQNNSHSRFEGPALEVVVEAESADDANARAEKAGLYFDGVDSGRDCDHCGNRWKRAVGPGTVAPTLYNSRLVDSDSGPENALDARFAERAGAYLLLVPMERAS